MASAGPNIVTSTTPGVNGNNFTTTPDTAPAGYTQPQGYTVSNDGLGVPSGAIKHVWVIMLENHAYEANFSGTGDDDYLSKQLPQAGALLTHYYGTGHSSLDNYISATSGQAPVTDDQDDCGADGYTALAGSVDTSGPLTTNGNYGQFDSAAGANAPAGDNGCVYPSSVPTVFNQLDAKGVSWKVYAQDLDNTGAAGQNAGEQYCGASDSSVGPTPSSGQGSNPNTTYPVDSSATAADQYVSKHNPLPWYESELNSGECNSQHLAPIFGGTNDALFSDLQSDSSTPDFSFIVPNNCSNGHDAVCAGNNLSGYPSGATTNTSPIPAAINNVGGSYSSNIFLEHTIPEIMSSPAYTDGGLIVVTWDEAYPQFTYSSDSLVDSTVSSATAQNSLAIDSAGETLFGRSLNWEPSGPNVPNVQSQVGQQMSAGPGYNEYLDRPGSSATSPLAPCNSGTSSNGFATMTSGDCYIGGGSTSNGDELTGSQTVSATTGGDVTTAANGSYGKLIAPDDEGEAVTLGGGVTGSDIDGASGSTGPFYVGQVTESGPAAATTTATDTTPADQTGTASFQLVDTEGNPVTLAGSLSSFAVTLAAPSPATDPLYDAYDPATGGGDAGALLLSPYINGGTVSNTYYNHYSLLRTIEDVFNVASGSSPAPGYTGSINVSTGVDGDGHLGYAAQPGLAPFGTDVFTDSPLDTSTSTVTTAGKTITSPGTTIVLPGTTVTTSHTQTVKTVYCVVPKVTGDSLTTAKLLLDAAQCGVGKVKQPHAKKGYKLVVKSSGDKAGKEEKRGTKVSLTLELKKS
jgi:Phosphoesterase family